MKEPLISFKTVKLAKEKGFTIPRDKRKDWYTRTGKLNSYSPKEPYYICTQSILQKWLREKHDIDIYLKRDRSSWRNTYWDYFIEHPTLPSLQSSIGGTTSNTYEEALEVALFEALKLIP